MIERFLVINVNLPQATGTDNPIWEPFQLSHFRHKGLFSIENKSRQIAWSWTTSAEAVAFALLYSRSSLFQSINLNEAKEKIRYAKRIIDAMPNGIKPKITIDNQQEIELNNGPRIISLPGNPQRGKAQFNVYLDEFAHIKKSREVYTAAIPVVTKGGQLRIGSSPMGAGNLFWEIWKPEEGKYTGYRRAFTPWYYCHSMTTNLRQAISEAPSLPTAERVGMFGNERIKIIFDNMLIDDFKQEFEGEAVDDKTAWITWEEIRGCQDSDIFCVIGKASKTDAQMAATCIDTLFSNSNRVEGTMVAGLDVGRTKDTTELFILGIASNGRLMLRLMLSLDVMSFTNQLAIIRYALNNLPIVGLFIDKNGIGMNLAESLEESHPTRAQGVSFTNQSKIVWATNAKVIMQQQKITLPIDRDLAYQIHSIRRRLSAGGSVVFDVESSGKHHADMFWSLALAITLGVAYTQNSGGVSVRETPRQLISAY